MHPTKRLAQDQREEYVRGLEIRCHRLRATLAALVGRVERLDDARHTDEWDDVLIPARAALNDSSDGRGA